MTGSSDLSAKAPLGRSPRWRLGAIFAVALLAAAVAGSFFANVFWPYRYRNVEPLMEKLMASQIKIDHYRRTYFPHPGFVASGLILRRNSAPDLPPVGTAQELIVQGEWNDLVRLRHRVVLVQVEGLHVVIPPVGSKANHEDFPPGSSEDFAGPTTGVENFVLHNAQLDILRTNGGRYTYPIKQLIIRNYIRGRKITYEVDMEDAMPAGHIVSSGSFGPLLPKALGATPLDGKFIFSQVALKDFGGIRGVLTSSGRFHGVIAGIEAQATTETPQFAVGNGRPTKIDTTSQMTINGLNGDVVLQQVEAKLGATTVQAQGRVVALAKDTPKVTDIDLKVSGGRVEDLLRPFLQSGPPMVGGVALHAHAHVAPVAPGVGFLERLTLAGAFDVPAERLTKRSTEEKLSAFSERARGGNMNTKQVVQAGDGEADVVSSLQGPVSIRKGVATTEGLTFAVPGAEAKLNGWYDLKTTEVHLLGVVKMEAGLSHVTTGFKSLLLTPLNPFFKGKKSGAVIPIAITGGGKTKYSVSQNIFHNK